MSQEERFALLVDEYLEGKFNCPAERREEFRPELLSLLQRAAKERVETPPGIDISADPETRRIAVGLSHTINLGNYQNVKPFFSVSGGVREEEDLRGAAQRIYREAVLAYAWLVGIEMRHAEVLSGKGPWEFVKALLDYAQPEGEESLVKAEE